jgi:RND family efflux transporter MFP subunit
MAEPMQCQLSGMKWVTGALFVATLALTACELDEKDVRLEPPLVRVTTVVPAAQAKRAFTGVISARVQSNLGFRFALFGVPGKIVERMVDTGQTVVFGQPLMRIDQTDLDLAITSKEKAVAAARAVAVQAAADEARYAALSKAGWSTQQKYEQAKAALDSANAQLAAAEAEAQVARDESSYSLLLADADGTIVETLAEPGQVVSAGQTVVRLAHQGPREATVNLPESVRPEIGSRAQAVLYNSAAGPWPARLRQLSDAADPQTRTYEARYVLEGDAARAPLGATVTIQIADILLAGMDEIPLGAIYDSGKGTGVWIVDEKASTVSFRPVQIRQLGEESAILRNGLREGDRIVALGAQLLHEGEKVRIAATEAASR